MYIHVTYNYNQSTMGNIILSTIKWRTNLICIDSLSINMLVKINNMYKYCVYEANTSLQKQNSITHTSIHTLYYTTTTTQFVFLNLNRFS